MIKAQTYLAKQKPLFTISYSFQKEKKVSATNFLLFSILNYTLYFAFHTRTQLELERLNDC